MTATILEQLDAVEKLLAADQQTIADAESAWEKYCAQGAMDKATQCEQTVAEAQRSIARLTIRKAALEAQSGAEVAAQKAAQVAHLKDAAVKLGATFEQQLGKVLAQVNDTTNSTYQLAELAAQVATARRNASKAGVVWDTKFSPQGRINEMHKLAQFIDGNCANCLQDFF